MRIDVVTIFPELFTTFFETGMVGRAARAGALDLRAYNMREHGLGRHRSVDDTPYGGGSGMVMRVDVVVACLDAIDAQASAEGEQSHKILLSPQGRVLDQRKVEDLAARPWITLVCGRYEGFDDRVHGFVDEEISLGDFVLAGGEVAAMAVVDACSRLLPGVLGSADSAMHESHSTSMEGLLEYPHYTRPEEFRGLKVPDVLKGGNHAEIARWRRAQAEARTAERRPDLWARAIEGRKERGQA
ncbi:tRNA (guanosine(37)-N1)-methyltransferase TrmD [Polyangium aurulentum]|uniref:tRNA (guanosine(37)-N1)-methyltransferase TrmD n=1 Tax=Polyangium aurulentum TaxID=2567896 RepID=UPI0010AE6650|nr:tRNA (guanosine(37)-N1)-methyltransferase TrmD [Polyangium aurulentum]UQA55908.1 tRNA (guanosine(37)-N1)-methyltransferase TrmD [Polyangium aurulentum]